MLLLFTLIENDRLTVVMAVHFKTLETAGPPKFEHRGCYSSES